MRGISWIYDRYLSWQNIDLVDHERKIAMTMYPLSKHMIDYGFTSWTNLPQPQQAQQSKPKLRVMFSHELEPAYSLTIICLSNKKHLKLTK